MSPRRLIRIPLNRTLLPTAPQLHPILDYPPPPDPSTLSGIAPAFAHDIHYPAPPAPPETAALPPSVINLPISALQRRTIQVKRTVNMTRKGKVPSMSALVVLGNGDGVLGYGEGKATEVQEAIKKATDRAKRSLVKVPRMERRTVFGELEQKFKSTRVVLRSRPAGFGNRANWILHEMFRCAGIRDVSGKVHGSRNAVNVVKAGMLALQGQSGPEELARGRGRKLVDIQEMYNLAKS